MSTSMQSRETRPLAAVTGASSGIGYELASCCARHGFDLLIAADEPAITDAGQSLRALGATVEAVEADLATRCDGGAQAPTRTGSDLEAGRARDGRPRCGPAEADADWAKAMEFSPAREKEMVQAAQAQYKAKRAPASPGGSAP